MKRLIGNFLILFAVLGIIATFGPSFYYEIVFRIKELRGVSYTVESPRITFGDILREHAPRQKKALGFSDVLVGPKEQVLIPIDTSFGILIPKIGANARIFPNTDPSSEGQFLPVLQKGIAHAKGTVFPGLAGNIYLFAHSADNFWNAGRYNASFYLLRNLKTGDDVAIFYQDRRYNYKVTESKIVNAEDISYITNAQKGTEQLILQTCWPPGTTWKRLLVFAKPK